MVTERFEWENIALKYVNATGGHYNRKSKILLQG